MIMIFYYILFLSSQFISSSSSSLLLFTINITCLDSPILLSIKSPIDISWLQYINEIKELNQIYNYSFLLYPTNKNIHFYIKLDEPEIEFIDNDNNNNDY